MLPNINHGFKYQRPTTSGYKDLEIRKKDLWSLHISIVYQIILLDNMADQICLYI